MGTPNKDPNLGNYPNVARAAGVAGFRLPVCLACARPGCAGGFRV